MKSLYNLSETKTAPQYAYNKEKPNPKIKTLLFEHTDDDKTAYIHPVQPPALRLKALDKPHAEYQNTQVKLDAQTAFCSFSIGRLLQVYAHCNHHGARVN